MRVDLIVNWRPTGWTPPNNSWDRLQYLCDPERDSVGLEDGRMDLIVKLM